LGQSLPLTIVVATTALVLVGCDPQATISVVPTAGPPGKAVTVTASGFAAGETVNIRFDAAKMTAVPADAGGAVHASFTVPSGATPGAHGVKARGRTTGRRAKTTFLVRTNWRQYGFDNARSGSNPYENVLGVGNVASLHELWSVPVEFGSLAGRGSPAVSDGVLYLNNGVHVDAIDLATHAVLWRGRTQGQTATAPTVSRGLVFVVDGLSKLHAFPVGCRSDGGECPVLWTSSAGAFPFSHPVAENGVVYVGGITPQGVAAYSASCGIGGATCDPLWTVDLGQTTSSPALDNGVLYVQTGAELFAIDVNTHGVLWHAAALRPNDPEWNVAPTVANGLVFVSTTTDLLAFPIGCAADGSECAPRWRGEVPAGEHPSSTASAADGKVFVQSGLDDDSQIGGHVLAFSMTCGTDGATCVPEWVASRAERFNWVRPAVANGVVYVGTDNSNVIALAADCSTGGGLCTPLWSSSLASRTEGLIVVDGVMYWAEEHFVRAFGP
jgi:outer membrane protein assembly factor BamB